MTLPRRICLIAEGQLGDLLILSPALRALKETFPSASLTVLVVQRRFYDRPHRTSMSVLWEPPRGGTSAVLLSDTNVDRVAEIDRGALRALGGLRRMRAEWDVLRWLRKGNFDCVVCTFPQDRFFLWAFLSGARIRVGEEGKPLSFLLTRRVRIKKNEGGVLAYYCSLAEGAGASVGSMRTSVAIPSENVGRGEALWSSLGLTGAQNVVAVHPGASGPYRIWPPEYYASLIDGIRRRGNPVILIGGSFDEELLGEISGRCESPPPCVVTKDVLDLAALLRKCALCISNNSGPRHLAVAAGVRSLALIPRFDDLEWKIYSDELAAGTLQSAKECPACPRTACLNAVPPGEHYGSWCMRAISVDEVTSRVENLLAG